MSLLFTSALAAVELNPDTCGRDFLTAMVIGYEVTIRAAAIRHATYKTYHSSGSSEAIFDKEAVAFKGEIEPEHAPGFDKTYPDQRLAQVVIRTKDNRLLYSGPLDASWAWPDSLPTDRELIDKFLEVVSLVLGCARAKEVSNFIWEFSSKNNPAQLIE
jgi:2-methylcitrate dehydratase PrpD